MVSNGVKKREQVRVVKHGYVHRNRMWAGLQKAKDLFGERVRPNSWSSPLFDQSQIGSNALACRHAYRNIAPRRVGAKHMRRHSLVHDDILYDSEQLCLWFPRSMYLDLEQTRMETGDITGIHLQEAVELEFMVEGKSSNLYCNLQKGKSWSSIEGIECFLSFWHNGCGSSTSGPWT